MGVVENETGMLKVECDRWNESASKLREEALKANHTRTRERLMALYEICNGKSATKVGRETGRNPQTVMEWVHRYNKDGPETLVYQHSGGHPPLYL